VKLCVIAPLNFLFLSKLGDMHFLLAQLAENEKYVEFYRKQRKYKILDNGAYEELTPMNFDSLLDAAKELQVNEVILPDYPLHSAETLRLVERAVSTLSKSDLKRYKFQAVPHGRTLNEWQKCLEKLLGFDEVSVIGFSILINKMLKTYNRVEAFNGSFKGIKSARKEVHVLGYDFPLFEVESFCSVARSIDTSLPVTLAHYNVKLVRGYDVKLGAGYEVKLFESGNSMLPRVDLAKCNYVDVAVAKHNILFLKRLFNMWSSLR